mgnify:CR=1 FL=1|jgi:hypothetical protein
MKKNIYSSIKQDSADENHALLSQSILEDNNEDISNVQTSKLIKQTNSVWPVEKDILVENVYYDSKFGQLVVTLTNMDVKIITIIQKGVKYSSNMTESIKFMNCRLNLKPGENKIIIPCLEGNPFKFVVRTDRQTGAGQSRDNASW